MENHAMAFQTFITDKGLMSEDMSIVLFAVFCSGESHGGASALSLFLDPQFLAIYELCDQVESQGAQKR